MQLEREIERQMEDNAFDYKQVQIEASIVRVYVFENYKAIDREAYISLFGGEGISVNDTMVKISEEQLRKIESDPRYEIQYIDMRKKNLSGEKEVAYDNALPDYKSVDIYDENKTGKYMKDSQDNGVSNDARDSKIYKEANDIYNENKDVSDDLLNMMEDLKTNVDVDESNLKK